MKKRRHAIVLGCAVLLTAAIGSPLVLIRALTFDPPATMPIAIEGTGVPWEGGSLSLLVWNVQYCASRRHHFFYDGGDAAHVPVEDVEATIATVAEVIRVHDPDVVLLQEVDRDSARTGRLDQLEAILREAPYPVWSSAPYHRVRYLPYPSGQHLGRVDMHLAMLSRYRLTGGQRWQLALLDEPWYRRAFNLKRALLETRVPRRAGGEVALLNTHLSAFSRGDGTLPRQVEQLRQRCQQLEDEGVPWILAGDLNLLPPGDDPARLGEDASLYADDDNPLQLLFDTGFRSAIAVDPPFPGKVGTYLPFGTAAADRTLDYVFVSEGIDVLSATVLDAYTDISDHLPLLVSLEIP